MRRLLAILILGLGLLVAPAADAAKRKRCTMHGAKVVRQDATARIFRVHRGGANWYYGCSLHGRPRLVDDDAESELGHFRLAYPFVAYTSYHEGAGDLLLFNLRTRTLRLAARFEQGASALDALALTRRGTLVWIRRGPTGRSVETFTGREASTLDPGPAVDAKSLAVTASGRRAYWTNAGEPRSAALP